VIAGASSLSTIVIVACGSVMSEWEALVRLTRKV
jgi:hypothetical protein